MAVALTRTHGRAAVIGLAVMIATGPRAVAGQVRGTVTDPAGRALPFATVVSQTGNGFLAVRTDLTGAFAFPGRPHRPGHTITVTSAGYRQLVYRLQPGDSVLSLKLSPDAGSPAPGWRVGLPVIEEVSVVAADGRTLRPGEDALVAGTVYRIRVVMSGPGCREVGPDASLVTDGIVHLAVAVFVRGGSDCASRGNVVRELPMAAPSANTTFWVVGRYRDVRVSFSPPR